MTSSISEPLAVSVGRRGGHSATDAAVACGVSWASWTTEVINLSLCRRLRHLTRYLNYTDFSCCHFLCGILLTEHLVPLLNSNLAQALRKFFHRDGSAARAEASSRSALSQNQVRELKAAFAMLDKNHDGRVNEGEIKFMLEKLGIVLKDAMVERLMEQASKRGDGLLSEEEFLTWMARQSVQDDVMADLLAAFRVFDKDRNGYITRDELRLAMEVIGEPVSEVQLDMMLRATDIDNDGRINYEEFVRMLL